ncbi:MAG: tellurite resistance protein TerY [Chloroflexi bacterium HGW-Chloroflexi-2]|nr:MAG: tellurite resistance protein TerY [Chloroflexi bacterium HGW-Chloroflexi-2]
MGLNSYVARELRALPIFVLADASGSMYGEKINELNLALREMLNSLNNVDDIRGKFKLSVISFGGSVKIVQPLADIEGLVLSELTAIGYTPMGEAFDVVKGLIEDRNIVSSRSYFPTIVLISDGIPTDCPDFIYKSKNYAGWKQLNNLHSGERSSKSQRLALGIGADADFSMLKAFINNTEIPVIKSKDAGGISKFFRWVTMSTVARMNSINPNVTSVVPPIFDVDAEDIII